MIEDTITEFVHTMNFTKMANSIRYADLGQMLNTMYQDNEN